MSTSAPDPDSYDFDLTAPDPGLLNPDLVLDAALAPTEDIESDAPTPLGRSWQFDFQSRQFVKDGTVPKVVYDIDALIVWIEKTVRTARLAHPIFDQTYGVDEPYEMIGTTPDDESLSAYQDAIDQALQVHDRIIAVEGFGFSQDPFEETLYASFTVVIDAAGTANPSEIELTDVPVGDLQ